MNNRSRPKRRRAIWMVPGGVVLLLGGLWLAGFFQGASPIPPEKIVLVERGDLARSVVARGKVEPRSSVGIKSKANGIIKELLVDEGEPVTKGQVLAELDKEDLAAQVREAKAGLEAEEANLQAATAAEAKARREAGNPELAFVQRDFERAQGLFKEKIASQQQLDDADRAYQMCRNRQGLLEAMVDCAAAQTRQVRARVAAAKAAVERAEEALGYATIRSPIDGIVLWRPTEVGHPVSSLLNLGSAASLIMILGDMSSVFVKGAMDEADVGKAQLHQCVRTRVEAYPNEQFDGVVQRIAPMSQEQGNVTTFEVRVTIANPQGKLRAGMTANAEIVLEELRDLLLVPETALIYEKDKSAWVQLLAPGTRSGWRKVPVKTGISNGQRTQVTDGLRAGDQLVLP